MSLSYEVRSVGFALLVLGVCLSFTGMQASGQMKLPPELTGKAIQAPPPKTQNIMDLAKLMDEIHLDKPSNSDVERINTFISTHPKYALGFAFRVVAACMVERPDLSQMDTDIQVAAADTEVSEIIKYPLSMRAKISFAKGNYKEALNQLFDAASEDWSEAPQIFNVGGTKPEDTSGGFCAWTLADLNQLGERSSQDWRIPVLRGLFYQFFTTFGDESLYATAETQYQLAATINPRSAIPQFLLGELRSKASFWTKKAWTSDSARLERHKEAAVFYSAAIQRDPEFKEAYLARAGAYLESKQYALAIKDFTKVIAMDPENQTAWADRGNAYSESGDYYKAIADFSAAIPLEEKSGSSYLYNLYENRGDAYAKVGDIRSAINDYSSALALNFGGSTLLLSISQIRALYPELNFLSDAALVKLMHDQFHPEIDLSDFSDSLLHKNGSWAISFTTSDLYQKRGDAYLGLGDFHDGVADFARIYRGIPNMASSTDRWRRLDGFARSGTYYLDVKGSDLSANNPILWTKRTNNVGSQLSQLSFDCSSHQMKTLSSVRYDIHENLISNSEADGSWSRVVPDSIGEQLWEGVCRE